MKLISMTCVCKGNIVLASVHVQVSRFLDFFYATTQIKGNAMFTLVVTMIL